MQGALTALQNWAPVAVIIGGYVIGLYFQGRSIAHLDKRIDDLRSYTDKGFQNVDKRIEDMRDVLRAEAAKHHSELLTKFAEMDSRIDRLEQQRWKP